MGERDVPRATAPTISSYPPSRPGGMIDEVSFSAFYQCYVLTLVAALTWRGAQLYEAADIAQGAMLKGYQCWLEADQPDRGHGKLRPGSSFASPALVAAHFTPTGTLGETPVLIFERLPDPLNQAPRGVDVASRVARLTGNKAAGYATALREHSLE